MPDVLLLNHPAPLFSLPADDGKSYSLEDFRGKSSVLIFFYPGDFTPVCTAEVCAFRDDHHLFEQRNITVFGISADGVEKHHKFAQQCKVPFRLLSDQNLETCRAYGARGLLGTRRAYYFIDEEGILRWQHSEILPIFKLSSAAILEPIDECIERAKASSSKVT